MEPRLRGMAARPPRPTPGTAGQAIVHLGCCLDSITSRLPNYAGMPGKISLVCTQATVSDASLLSLVVACPVLALGAASTTHASRAKRPHCLSVLPLPSPQRQPLFSGRKLVSLRQDKAFLQAVLGDFWGVLRIRSRREPGGPVAARTASLTVEAACCSCCEAHGPQDRPQVVIRCIARRNGPRGSGFWKCHGVKWPRFGRPAALKLEPPHVVQPQKRGCVPQGCMMRWSLALPPQVMSLVVSLSPARVCSSE